MDSRRASNARASQLNSQIEELKDPAKHKRNYQACTNCRGRKVKCDLGDVDDPHDPPCSRCRRERMTCYFATHRRKGKRQAESEDVDVRTTPLIAPHNAKRRLVDRSPSQHSTVERSNVSAHAAGMIGLPYSQHRISESGSSPVLGQPSEGMAEQEINPNALVRLQLEQIPNTHRALDCLASVLTDANEDSQRQSKDMINDHGSGGQGQSPPLTKDDVMDLWETVTFVQKRDFSAKDAVHFVQFFYDTLYPLTPIIVPDFRNLLTHARLLQEEPMLALTILTIAARHCPDLSSGVKLQDHGIHEKLWTALQTMIGRMLLGQDHLEVRDAGFQPSWTSQRHARGLRTLGMIESFLLLIEWHPSAIHFDSTLVIDGILDMKKEQDSDQDIHQNTSVLDAWREPGYRSDAMDWSFLGLAMSLALELGLFNADSAPHSVTSKRAENIRCLLYISDVQLSGRLSIPSMIGEQHWAQVVASFNHAFGSKKRKSASSTAGDDIVEDAQGLGDAPKEVALYFWFRIAYLSSMGNKMLWPSLTRTREIIEKGQYADLLDKLTKSHTEWRQDLEKFSIIPENTRCILDIEYYYMRAFSNNIAIQATVQRYTNLTPQNHSNPVSSELFESCMGEDRKFFDMIVDDSKKLLHCVVDTLHRRTLLAHVSSRTFWRIANVAIILLKTLALGKFWNDLTQSLDLLEKAAWVMSINKDGDVHIKTEFAKTLREITSRVRKYVVRGIPQFEVRNLYSLNILPQTQIGQNANMISPLRRQQNINPPSGSLTAGNAYNAKRLAGSSHSFSNRRPASRRPSPLNQSQSVPTSLIISPTGHQTFTKGDANNLGFDVYGRPQATSMYAPWSQPYNNAPPSIVVNDRPIDEGIAQSPAFYTQQHQMMCHSSPRVSAPNGYATHGPFAHSQGINSTMVSTPMARTYLNQNFMTSPQSAYTYPQEFFDINWAPLSGRQTVHQSTSGPIIQGQGDPLDMIGQPQPMMSATRNGVPSGWDDFNRATEVNEMTHID